MTIREILNKVKNSLPWIAFPLALHSNHLARQARKAKEEFINSTNQTRDLIEQVSIKQDLIIKNTSLNNKITNLTKDASTEVENLNVSTNLIKEHMERLNDPFLKEEHRELIVKELEEHNKLGVESLEKINKTLQEILDEINKSGDNFLSQLNILIERYKEFLSTLSVEQLDIVVNTLGYIIILTFLISIAAVLYGDFLIRYFKLEENFPKIAIFIKLRRKFQ